MINYFEKFPKILYDIAGNNIEKIVRNITHRAAFRDAVKSNIFVWYQYVIQDGDTPEIIASKYYGSPNYHWIILLGNDIIDPYFDWPMTYDNFQNWIIKEFGGIPTAQQTIQQYLDSNNNPIDLTAYNLLPSNQRSTVSVYDYYFNLNETKRTINILDKQYLSQIDKELTDLLQLTT